MNKTKIKIIGRFVAEYIAEFFPYYLALYVLVFLLSFFFQIWQSFWLSPMLHISLVVFGLIYLLEKNGSFSFSKVKLAARSFVLVFKDIFHPENRLKLFGLVKSFGHSFIHWLKKAVAFCWTTLKYLWAKVKDGGMVKFSASFALFFLALCPFLLMFKKDALAERSAIYAYYFLVISVILMIIENYLDKSPENGL